MKNTTMMMLALSACMSVPAFAAPFAIHAADADNVVDSAAELKEYKDNFGGTYMLNTKTKEASLVKIATRNDNGVKTVAYNLQNELTVEGVTYTVTTVGSFDDQGNGVSLYDTDAAEVKKDAALNSFQFASLNPNIPAYPSKITVCQDAFEGFSGVIVFPKKEMELKWGVKSDFNSFGSAVGSNFQGAIIGGEAVKKALDVDAKYCLDYLQLVDFQQEVKAGEAFSVTVKGDSWSEFVTVQAWFTPEKDLMNNFPNGGYPATFGVTEYGPTTTGPVPVEMEVDGNDANGNVVLKSKDLLRDEFGIVSVKLTVTMDDSIFGRAAVNKADAPKSEWIELKDGKYNYSNHGELLKDCWWKIGNDWFHFNEVGIMAENEWINLGKNDYAFVDRAGHAIIHRWAKIDGTWYYFNVDGKMYRGLVQDKKDWYLLKEDGKMAESEWVKLDGSTYYFDNSGARKTGWLRNNGSWYFLNKETGAMQTGWVKDAGNWYYLKANGVMAVNEWIGDWYADANGVCTKK